MKNIGNSQSQLEIYVPLKLTIFTFTKMPYLDHFVLNQKKDNFTFKVKENRLSFSLQISKGFPAQ